METVYIVLIIVIGIVTIVFVLRDRLTSFRANVKGKRGNNEVGGGVGMNAYPPDSSTPTKVSGNRMIGKKQRIDVREKGAEVEKNRMEGEELEIKIDNPNASEDADKPE